MSFNGAPDALLEKITDQSIRNILTEAELWGKDLSGWIQFVRCNKSLLCPEFLRHTSIVSMGLQFTDDITIQALNADWRNISEKTDVLSFPVFDEKMILPPNQPLELGDIVVSIETAAQQAEEHHHSLRNELRWLVSHGLLHLLGWEHSTPTSLKEMLSCQKQLLRFDGNL